MAVVKRSLPATPAKKTAPPADAPKSPLRLPDAPSTPSDALDDYSMLLFGEKKIGKTTLASMFEKPLFLMTEPGGKSLPIYQMPITDWMQMKTAVTLLQRDPTKFRTIVVDTVDIAFKLCERYVCRNLGIDHPSDEDWGKGWSAVRDEFTSWAATLMNLGMGVILISHAADREIKTRSGMKYNRVQPTMTGMARDVIEGMVDIWAYYDYVGSRRTLTIRGDEHIAAGHRLQNHFRYQNQEVLTIDMGVTPQEAYRNLVAAFNNTYVPANALPEPEAVAPIRKLKRA